MNKNKLIAVSVLAGVMLAACSVDGGGSVAKLMKAGETPQAQMQAPAPTPQVQVKEVERVVTQMATVVVNQPVEVTREVPVVQYVEVTPQPDIQGFAAIATVAASGVTGYADTTECDISQPQPAPRAGNVDRVIGCANAWDDAYGVKP